MVERIKHVYFFHHTHTDIGYTHAQEEVAEQQAANIARALDFCRQTEGRAPESRFAWTVETGWTLARFWERASRQDRERFAQYARQGRVQITASYFHLTQLAPPELLIRSLEPTFAIAQECGVSVDTAMSSDINGVNWFYVHLLAQAGVRYLNTAVNTTRGGSPIPAERPGGFWWEGPTGDRLLVWNNDSYMNGNWILSFPESPSFDGLLQYLAGLEERGYPYDTVLIPVQGYIIDNAAPNLAICDLVEQFNQEAGRSLCRLVTLGEALRDIEARYGNVLPVRRGAWPDWWDDGVASSAFETGLVRYAHGDLLAAEKAAALASALGAPNPFTGGELERLRENLLHYDEHTWGWWRSVEDPHSLESRALGHRKILYAEDAALEGRRYRERAVRALAGQVVSSGDDDRLILFNPLGWPRRDLAHWNARWKNPADHVPTALRVLDAEGREVTAQNRLERYTGHLRPYCDLWVDFVAEVPALGYAVYRLEETGRPVQEPVEEQGRVIENTYYRVEMDEQGRVRSLVDKTLAGGRELVAAGPFGLQQLIYEQITSPGGRADTLKEQYPPFDFTPNRATMALSSPEEMRVCVRRDALGVSLISAGRMPNFPTIVQEVRLDNGAKRVDFTTRFVKAEVDATEALYIAFPLALRLRAVRCDISGGVFTPGSEQIPGTVTDWYNTQHGVQLSGDDITLTWLCGEAPLVEFGEMKTGKTPSPVRLDSGTLFSYALNNHWFTNFFARQAGEFTLRYRLLSAPSAGTEELGRAGREFLNPLVPVGLAAPSARDAGAQIAAATPRQGSASMGFAEIVEGHAALDAVKVARDGEGWILRLHEIAGRAGPARLRLRWPTAVRVSHCDVLERTWVEHSGPAAEHDISVDLQPFGTATLRLGEH